MKHRHLVLLFVVVTGLAEGYHIAGGQARGRHSKPIAIANALDALIQPRFQVEAGVFGMSRIGIQGHDAIIDDVRATKVHFMAKLSDVTYHTGFTGTVGFLHCVSKPGKFKPTDSPEKPPDVEKLLYPKPRYDMYYVMNDRVYTNGADGVPDKEAHAWNERNRAVVETACVHALPRLEDGIEETARLGEMLVVMRPVRALHVSCVSCHVGARRGDTLGVMVYTVAK